MSIRAGAAVAAAIVLSAASPTFSADQVAELSFTAEQAERGVGIYRERCESCHGGTLSGEGGPPLAGDYLFGKWGGAALSDLFLFIQAAMPEDSPGSLSGSQVANVLAYILAYNGFAPGVTALPSDGSQVQGTLPEDRPE